ncbi:MAG: transketolase [Rhizobiales bacterium NRL2]|nr:MAG: transketolase [Rhizobiales bacterium NRL2]
MPDTGATMNDLHLLQQLERKVLWLSSWTIHHANHVRENRDGLKVGGHQASCASVSTLMTALYFAVLRPEDRVAVKPHASPVFHAIQYLFGRQSRERLERFRAWGGAQSYPSRTKDADDVDYSTGSVGLGVAATMFSSMIQDYVRLHRLADDSEPPARMVAVLGDAELDEGNVFEALLEGWKHDVRNLWWIIDYNRQSLDGVVNDRLFEKITGFFRAVGWEVVTLKYGKLQQQAFEGPAGGALKAWIDDCPNQLYSALTFKGGAAWREHLARDLKDADGGREFLDSHDDAALQRLMTNLAGHDMAAVLEGLRGVNSDLPHCFVAYTVKGFGLPLAGHKDNHAGLMTPDQMAGFREIMGVAEGEEWSPTAGLEADADDLMAFLRAAPFNAREPLPPAPLIAVPEIAAPAAERMSTQEAFGRILNDLSREDSDFTRRMITASPDVTVSTNLGPWVNRRKIFDRNPQADVFREERVASPQRWEKSPTGQHVELGIAENNLFLFLSQAGLADRQFGARLLPVGTLYDPFIARGLDALNYACYQDARFMVVATPSGVSLAPEGGAHQSVSTPLIGLGQPGLLSYEPAFADELAAIMAFGFRHMQADDGAAIYLRLSTRALAQPERELSGDERDAAVLGARWLVEPSGDAEVAVAFQGAIAAEALKAFEEVAADCPGAGLLAVTSADRLYRHWKRDGERSHVASLLARLAQDAGLVTVIDGHPATLAWLGGVKGHATEALGVTRFGQSGDTIDLYADQGIDADAIADAAARALVRRAAR